MRVALAVLGAAFLLIVGILCWSKFERHGPRVSAPAVVQFLGRTTPLDFDVQSDPPGLRSVTVRLQSGGTTYDVASEIFPAPGWRRSGVLQKRLHIEADPVALKVPEGAATIEVYVETYAWHLLPVSHGPKLALPVTIDLTPPKIEPLTTQHYVRLGGMDAAVFRQSADTVRSGVEVDKYFFPAQTGYRHRVVCRPARPDGRGAAEIDRCRCGREPTGGVSALRDQAAPLRRADVGDR
jgi:hypothetical protein